MTISAVDCHYSITGSGPPLFLTHGIGAAKMHGDLCYLNYQKILP